MSKKQEVAVAEKNEVANVVMSEYAGYGIEDMSLSDMTISRIHCLQANSELVKQRKGFAGDIVDLSTGEKLGDTETAFEVVPFNFGKEFIVEIQDGARFKFLRKEPFNKETSFRETKREEVINGVLHRWVLCINVHVLLKSDLGNPAAFPYMITFKMTSLKAGKDLFSNCLKASKAGMPIWAISTPIKSVNTDNDKGSWSTYSLGKPSMIQDRESYDLDFVTWCKMIKSGSVKIAEDVVDNGDDLPF